MVVRERRRRRPQRPDADRHSVVGGKHRRELPSAAVGHDHVGDGGVVGLAGRVQRREGVTVTGERTAAADAPRPRGLHVDVDPDDGVAGHGVADLGAAERSPAERDHARTGGVEQLERQPSFPRPKRRFAVGLEDLLDRLTGAAGDLLVDVDGLDLQRIGDRPRRGRLAGAHEADDGQGRVGHPVSAAGAGAQPIRSR
jgi:hypothetical protein